jgi:hypothetical protein
MRHWSESGPPWPSGTRAAITPAPPFASGAYRERAKGSHCPDSPGVLPDPLLTEFPFLPGDEVLRRGD